MLTSPLTEPGQVRAALTGMSMLILLIASLGIAQVFVNSTAEVNEEAKNFVDNKVRQQSQNWIETNNVIQIKGMAIIGDYRRSDTAQRLTIAELLNRSQRQPELALEMALKNWKSAPGGPQLTPGPYLKQLHYGNMVGLSSTGIMVIDRIQHMYCIAVLTADSKRYWVVAAWTPLNRRIQGKPVQDVGGSLRALHDDICNRLTQR